MTGRDCALSLSLAWFGQPRPQGLFPGLAAGSSQGKDPGNEVDSLEGRYFMRILRRVLHLL